MRLLNNFSIKTKSYLLVGLSVVVALVLLLVSNNGMRIIEDEVNDLILVNAVENHTRQAILEEKNYLLNANGSIINHKLADEAYKNTNRALREIYSALDKLEYRSSDSFEDVKAQTQETREAIAEYEELYKRGVYLLEELEKERLTLQDEGENITRQIQMYVEAKRVEVKKELSQKTIEKINAGSNIWQYTYMTRADEKRYLLSPNEEQYESFKHDYAFMMSELERLKKMSNQPFEHERIAVFFQSAKNYETAMHNWVKYNKEHVQAILPKTKKLGEEVIVRAAEIADRATEEIVEKRKAVINTSIIVTLLVILVGIIFGSMVSRSISSVLLNFQEGLLDFFKYLDRRKNSANKIEITSRDEIAMMAEVVNENIVKIEEVIEKKLVQMQEKDEQMRKQSRLAQMGEMISMIAHQWRQPLAAIAATTSDMEIKLFQRRVFDMSTSQGQSEMEKYTLESLSAVNGFVTHLSETIDDFRNFFKSNKDKSSFHLSELMEKTLNLTTHLFKAKGIEVVKAYSEERPELKNYENEVMQVLLNIINNAADVLIEKSIDDPHIYITVDTNRVGHQIVTIEDNGGGIPDEDLAQIFDPYFSTKDKNGTGLGLYMSQLIIEEHCNGHISATNTSRGACFMIEFMDEVPETDDI